MLKKPEEVIPEQQTGTATDTKSEVVLSDEKEAVSFFKLVKERLLQVNNWQQIAGQATASFQLTDEKGNPVNRNAKTGDHFRIDIPGPGSQSGEGYDWVQIEVLNGEQEKEADCYIMRVRPATNPTNEKKDVAHFFSEEATSTFMVKREGCTVTASVHGRNEKPNTDTETLLDKVRHTAVATGALSGFAKIQWKNLVNGLVKKN